MSVNYQQCCQYICHSKTFICLRKPIHIKYEYILGAFAELWKATITFVVSVRMEELGSHWMGFEDLIFEFSKHCRKSQISRKSDRNNVYFTWRLFTFMASRWIRLRMRNVSDKSCRENRNTHFMFNSTFSKNRAVYEIMSTNMVEPERPQMTLQYGACALNAGWSKTTRTHAQKQQAHTQR